MKQRFRTYAILFTTLMISAFCFYGLVFHYKSLQIKPAPPFLTIIDTNGRLGNQMCLMATLYGLSTLNGRQPVMNPNNYDYLSPYFDIHIPVMNIQFRKQLRKPWKIGKWLSPGDKHIPAASNIIVGNTYPTSFTFFDHVREEVRKIFKFKEEFRKHADGVFRHVKNLRPWTRVFVCVHVRRGDYLSKKNGGWLRAAEGREVDRQYFVKAVQKFQSMFQNITFLAVSDDRRWTRDNLSSLGILTLPESPSAGHDLAVLASCNHTIMTYGTFGFWGGYLSGGKVIYFTNFIKPGSYISKNFKYEKMYPKEWIGISTTPPNFWKNFTSPFVAN